MGGAAMRLRCSVDYLRKPLLGLLNGLNPLKGIFTRERTKRAALYVVHDEVEVYKGYDLLESIVFYSTR